MFETKITNLNKRQILYVTYISLQRIDLKKSDKIF